MLKVSPLIRSNQGQESAHHVQKSNTQLLQADQANLSQQAREYKKFGNGRRRKSDRQKVLRQILNTQEIFFSFLFLTGTQEIFLINQSSRQTCLIKYNLIWVISLPLTLNFVLFWLKINDFSAISLFMKRRLLYLHLAKTKMPYRTQVRCLRDQRTFLFFFLSDSSGVCMRLPL